MMNLEYFFSLYMFIFSLMMLCLFFKHLMCLIISLEFLLVSAIFNMYVIMINIESGMFMILFFLVMGVCEGVLSLSLVILMARFYGNDYISSVNLNKW